MCSYRAYMGSPITYYFDKVKETVAKILLIIGKDNSPTVLSKKRAINLF
jgi:hypothetical protein